MIDWPEDDPPESQSALDVLYAEWRRGSEQAGNELFDSLYSDLKRIASSLLRRDAGNLSLATGDLVGETVLRLLKSGTLKIVDEAHLRALCARIMRNTLTDAAKRRRREKRRAVLVTLNLDQIEDASGADRVVSLLALVDALDRLRALHPRWADVVELKYFGGFTNEEVAAFLGISVPTVKRAWNAAVRWLTLNLDSDT
ncbi:MAG: sigma-70 family RNA polymerase sigma factor [Pseudomonadales bacterium]|nr:sigma-70 family RNA polymerase sigma factor [Pseudomonadales bacterium]MCP5183363.1 sigma-70 family RNA polymerase sigma factor [Pseudomonadales bacterium]